MRKYLLMMLVLIMATGLHVSYGADGGQWLEFEAIDPSRPEDGLYVKNYNPPATTTSAATKVTIPEELGGFPVVQINYPSFKGNETIEHVVIPDSVTHIYGGFDDCNNLKRVDIPDSVVAIAMGTFEGCENLQDISLGRVTQLETGILEGCSSLENIEIPNSVTSISYDVFKDCVSIESITIPDSVTDFASGAFEGCTALEEVRVDTSNTHYRSQEGVLFTKDLSRLIHYPANKSGDRYMIPETVEIIDWYAFEDNPHLEWLSITKNVEKISEDFNNVGPFLLGCKNVSEIVVDGDNPYFSAEEGILYNKDKSVLRRYPEGKAGKTHTIDGRVETVGRSAFREVKDLEHIILQGTLKEVKKDGFYNCTGLEFMTLPFTEVDFGEEALAGVSRDLVIKGTTGGFAEQYAQVFGYTFEDLGALPIDSPRIEDLRIDAVTTTTAAVSFTVSKEVDYKVIALHPSDAYSPLIWHPSVTPKVTGHAMAGENLIVKLEAYKGDNLFEPGSAYKVYVYVTDADNNYSHDSIEVHTLYSVSEAPPAPVVQSKTYDEVRLKVVSGMEYSINNGLTWQSSHIFKDLAENTSYDFIQRLAAHDYYPASYVSTHLSVKTTERYPDSGNSNNNSGSSSSGGSGKKSKKKKESKPVITASEQAGNQTDTLKPEIIKNDEREISLKLKEKIKESARIEIPDEFVGNDIVTTVDAGELKVKLNGKMFKDKSDHVDLEIKKVDKAALNISSEAKDLIGDSPVFDISLIVNKNKVDWSSDTPIEIEIAVDDQGKAPYKFVAVYIDGDGQTHLLKNSYYNGQALSFDTTHLSHYSVMYMDKTFEDVETHWSKEAVEALAVRDFIKGRPDGMYVPDASISRAELVTLMTRFFDLKGEGDVTGYFDDVLKDEWYAESLSAAISSKIVPYDSDDFLSDEAATREEMMYMLHHSILAGYKELNNQAISLDDFVDISLINPEMVESVEFCLSKGLIKGNNAMIKPTANLSRGEVAQVFYNLLKKSYE